MHSEDVSKSKDNSKYILSSVDNVLQLLNLFLEYEELDTNQAANLLNTSRSSIFRSFATLENRGFISRTRHDTYRLGLNTMSLGMLAYNRMELVTLIHPYLEKMAQISTETSHLTILDDGIHVVFIDRVLGTRQLKMDTQLGYRTIAHCTASGKAILAYQPDSAINKYLQRTEFPLYTSTSLKNARELLNLLDQIRQQGYACDNEEVEPGLTCFSKPLLDPNHHAYAAISISGPTTRMQAHKEEHLALLNNIASETLHSIR